MNKSPADAKQYIRIPSPKSVDSVLKSYARFLNEDSSEYFRGHFLY